MRASIVVASLLFAMGMFGDETFTVRGSVIEGSGGSLPGCTVALHGGGTSRYEIANADGRYEFARVSRGDYTLSFTLTGFITTAHELRVAGDVQAAPEELQMAEVETITVACGAPACSVDRAPQTAYDQALCSDVNLNTALIEAVERGDASAIQLLQQRFETTLSHEERHRIAVRVLARVPDDRRYWSVLEGFAAEAIRFAYENEEPTPQFIQWCAAHNIDAETHHDMIMQALHLASGDDRAGPLMLRALDSKDRWIVASAIIFFARRKDESVLHTIRAALERITEDRGTIAYGLVMYASEAADTVALSVLQEEDGAAYVRQRDELRAATAEYR